jgi:hypothetical protein
MIETSYSSTALTLRSRQRALKLTSNLLRAERANAEALKRRAIQLSSGNYSAAWLRQQARLRGFGLYSVASPAPADSAFIINSQSGSLRSHWQTRIVVTADGTSISLWNTDPKAKFMLGTPTMIFRPIMQAVSAFERGPRFTRLAAAKSASFK